MLKLSNPLTNNIIFLPLKSSPCFGCKREPKASSQSLKALEKDVFVLSSPSQNDKKEFLNLSEDEMKRRILTSVNKPENLLGYGCEAAVYNIEGTRYCARIPCTSRKLKESRIIFKLTEKDRINHVVAKFSNGVTIMKIIEGFPLSERHTKGDRSHKNVNKLLLDIPVSSYSSLFKQICHAKDNGMIFDCNASNVIVNSDKRTITAIDFYEMDPDYPEEVKPLRHMYAALADDDSFSFKKGCAGKIILGALEEFKPGVKPCLNIGEFKFIDFMESIQAGTPLKSSQEWAKLKDVLTDIQCLKIKETAGVQVAELLQNKLDEARSLVGVLSSCV